MSTFFIFMGDESNWTALSIDRENVHNYTVLYSSTIGSHEELYTVQAITLKSIIAR